MTRLRRLVHGVLSVGLCVILIYVGWLMGESHRVITFKLVPVALVVGEIDHPAHVVQRGGRRWAAEVISNRVVSWPIGRPVEQITASVGTLIDPLASPHFLHVMEGARILVSEGWGQRIRMVDTQAMRVIDLPTASDLSLNAPHGICVRDTGEWLYIADSLNSRLVRVSLQSQRWQVFADHDRRVAYGRQLLCREDGLWLANSHENRAGLNPGIGSNVLRINDFESGRSEVMAAFGDANMTGLEVVDDRWLLVGLWGQRQTIGVVDLLSESAVTYLPSRDDITGPPYGFFFDTASRELLVAYLGDIRGRSQTGGFAVYHVPRG
ncbi:MAG: hypothetical protein P8J24_01845 [Arenicellales bacterium]|nr:hypothetical protein [Arenicellales bacterium]